MSPDPALYLAVELKKITTRYQNILKEHSNSFSGHEVQKIQFIIKSNGDLIKTVIGQALIDSMKANNAL